MRTPTRTLLVLVLAGLSVSACAAVDAGLRVGDAEGIATSPPPETTPSEPTEPVDASDPPVASTEPAAPPTDATDVEPASSGPVFTLDPDKPPQSYDIYLAAAVNDIQSFWRAVYPQLYGEPYVELSGGIFPVYPGREDVPGCGQTLTTYSEIRGNAFYCFEGDFIAYDDADLLPQLYEQLGPAVIGVVLAHEWGHAIQRRIAYQDATIYMEQQADCFAGAWIAHLARGENSALPFADADLKNAINGMIQVRDQPGTGATGEAAHGTAFDRVGAFQDGFINGASQCATYPDEKPLVLSFGYGADRPIDEQENAPFESTSTDPSQPNDIISLVVAELNVFWPPLVDGMPELTLTPYDGDPESACSDLPEGRSLSVAFFCPGDEDVRIDLDAARQLYNVYNDFAVGYVLAAAWAEGAQSYLDSSLSGEARVLANDCLVGAFARSTLPVEFNPNRSKTDTSLSPGDLDEAVTTAVEVGDDSTDTNEFGSPFEKIDAFRTGVLGDFQACQGRFGF
ncbi:MAG TPA: neutral zinc metallopeptidase [Ilumatobacteraceae bacterium]